MQLHGDKLTIFRKLEIINSIVNLPSESTQMLDMTYFSPYNAQIGFRVGVEALYNNMNQGAFYTVVASLCPSAKFYETTRATSPEDVSYLAFLGCFLFYTMVFIIWTESD